jgi:hypothetical protein
MTPKESIAHYRIVSKLGEGGMGAVYRATDTKLNRDVAIKVLPSVFADDTGRMQRFSREAQVLAALNHPNIAGIYGIEEGALVMELVDGEPLHGPVPVETAIRYACQIAMGLSYERRQFRLSPDGRSVAYESQESHGAQVVVAAFPSFNEKRQVSVGGGSNPVWRPDGKEIFFLAPDWTLMGASMETGGKIKAGIPGALFKLPLHPYGAYYEVSADGKRILVLDNLQSRPNAQINVLVNWTSRLDTASIP